MREVRRVFSDYVSSSPQADSAIYESCLEIQLDHAVIRPGLKVPNLKPIPFGALCDNVKYPNAMDKSGSAMAQLTTFEKQLWKLGWSLFDALPAVDADASFEIDKDDKESEYVTEQKRKDRLSHWLKNTVQPVAKQEIDQITSKATDRDTLPAKVIFALLSCRNIGEAHAVALKSRSFFLATIIAQLSDNSGANCDFSGSGGLDDQSREDLYNQVRLWTAEKGMKGIPLVPQDVVRIYRLLCCDMDAIHEDLKLSGKELDWKRTFGLYFWYWATANNKIVDALDAYDLAIDATTAKSAVRAPQPWYTELSRANDKTDRRSAPRDLLYHLLKIYTNPEHPLEMAIQPVNFYPPPESAVRQFKLGPIASHRMLWHLWSVLKSQNIRTFRDDGGAIDVSLDRSADFGIDGRAEDASFAIMDVDSNAMALDRGSEDDSPSSDSWHGAYLTMAYVMELEHAGLWHWAVFVALHFCNRAR